MSDRIVTLTKKQYNYLLPAYNLMRCARKLFYDGARGTYAFFGNNEEIKDMYNRLIGLSW